MLPEKSKPISSSPMSIPYYENIERQKALYESLKIIATSNDDTKRENAAEAVALMIAQDPLEKRIKNRLSKGQLRFYPRAIENTRIAVKKGIVNFSDEYNWNVLDIDEKKQALKRLENSFVSWVRIILKRQCIEEYRKTNEGKEARRKREEEKRGEKIKRRANRNSKYQEVELDRSFGSGGSEKMRTLEQNIYVDIEGNFVGEIGKDARSLDGIDSLIAKEQAKQKPLGTRLKEYIEQDPNNRLKNEHPRGKKECNCQILLQLSLLEDLSMDEVYARLQNTGCKPGTIRNWLTEHKSEKSQNRKSCINLMQQIVKEKFND